MLSEPNIYAEQLKDPVCNKIRDYITGEKVTKSKNRHFLHNEIIYLQANTPSEKDKILLPESLVSCCLAFYHLQSHSGA
jgi:hypothetical protein